MKKCVIVGAGAYGQVYVEYLSEIYDVQGFFDSNPSLIGIEVSGYKVLGSVKQLPTYMENHENTAIFVPLGNNKRRVELLKIYEEKGYELPSFVHKSVYMHDNVILGKSVYMLPSTNVMPYTNIGDYTMVSIGVNIAHHVDIAPGCFFSQGCNIGASIKIAEKAYFGMAASVMTGVKTIGTGSLIGVGAVVIRDVPAKAVIVGNPGKVLRYIPEKGVLNN
ncbi:MAG TPA: acetyltransferase [Leeuwenhoekiella sp.]|nr:acetyltransferase [Leeuwenhoekiella sp.]